MNENLEKAYDIIKEEQRNADNKAYLFIGLITVVVGLFGKIPTSGYSPTELSGMLAFMFILLFPLLLLVISLIPNYKVNMFLRKKSDNFTDLNIFYWRTVVQSGTIKEFLTKINEKYNQELKNVDIDLADQIYKNAKIMSTKATLHEIAFKILIHILIFLFASIVTVVFSNSSTVLFVILFVVIEVLYFLVPIIKNKPKK